jgi:chemotaxis protein histidine kinase CheA
VGDTELLQMLATEADRRVPVINEGLESLADAPDPDPARVERLRVEAHGLKGAALVIGQSRLAELADRSEKALAERIEPGTVNSTLAKRLASALEAFHDGAQAAAKGDPEPASVTEALGALRA